MSCFQPGKERIILSGLLFNRERALEYITTYGNELEQARIAHILDGVKPPPGLEHTLAMEQNEDGGFPFPGKKGSPSTLSYTTFTLAWLDDLGLLHGETGRRAVGFIASRQKDDGSWDENPAVNSYNPPLWMKPGEPAAIVYNTAGALFWLLLTGKAEDSLSRGLAFLVRHQTPSGAFFGFRHSTWLAVSVFGMAAGWDAAVVRRSLDYLAGIPAQQWVASQISWMLWTMLKCGVPRKHFFVVRMIDLLSQKQERDGSFPAEDGPDYTVNATIEALKVVHLYEN